MNSANKKASVRKPISRPLSLLGGMDADVFLRDYWQQKPLLVRKAIAEFRAPLSKREVLALARRDEAESRLITRSGAKWQIEHGPFSTTSFRKPKDVLWTVLVQDVQHFSHEAHQLLARFNFIPQARIDDLMVSYAVTGAGVGAHFDSYDVFLLQGAGTRRWQISQQSDLRLKPDLPLKILSHFKPTQEFVLETGDMLYLPPSVAHSGVAESECLTWSIGFRAPSKQDLSIAFLDYLSDAPPLRGQYADPDLRATRRHAQIDTAMQRRFAHLLLNMQDASQDAATIRRFVGCYLTEPKSHVVFDPPDLLRSAIEFGKLAARYGLELDLKTRMLYDKEHIFINGEAHTPVHGAEKNLRAFANRRLLSAASFAQVDSKPLRAFLYAQYCDGAMEIARH